MKKLIFALTVLVNLLTSCTSKKRSVAYNAAFCKEHVVKIDDTLTLTSDTRDRYAKLVLMGGEHSLSIDGGKPTTFDVDDNGILNLANEEFVIFPLEYYIGRRGSTASTLRPNSIVIDSFAVGSQFFLGMYANKLNRRYILEDSKGSADSELKKTDKDQLYISEAWEIGLADEAPRSVKEYVDKDRTSGSTFRTKVVEAKSFLLYALETREYTVLPVSSFKD
jgi:hypothetical protein